MTEPTSDQPKRRGERFVSRPGDSAIVEPGTQLTQPAKGDPVEIPVPKRKDVLDALEKAARPPDSATTG